MSISQTINALDADAIKSSFSSMRSDWMDDFARLETNVFKAIVKFGCDMPAKGSPFGQRIEALSKAKAGSSLSKERVAQLPAIAKRCARLAQIRTSIAHGVMTIGRYDEHPIAMFQNAADAAVDLPCYLVLNKAKFGQLRNEIRQLADELGRMINPPASPPQPARAAAGGP